MVLEKMKMWKVYVNKDDDNDNDDEGQRTNFVIRKAHLSLRLRWAKMGKRNEKEINVHLYLGQFNPIQCLIQLTQKILFPLSNTTLAVVPASSSFISLSTITICFYKYQSFHILKCCWYIIHIWISNWHPDFTFYHVII